MTSNIKKTVSSGTAYPSPRARVILVKPQHVLCGSLDGSPSLKNWNDGSESIIGFGDEDDD